MDLGSTVFWLALGKIIWINLLLSGDNAVVIALAARSLPPQQQKRAIAIGSGAAIVMRIVLTFVAVKLLTLPGLKLIGAALLIYIGVSLLRPEDEGGDDGSPTSSGMMAAVRTILIADLVMSLDNVLAVAAAASGDATLLIAGLAISIPLVIFGSTLLLKVIERLPIIVWFGAALLGYIAGEIFVTDPTTHTTLVEFATTRGWGEDALHHLFGAIGAVLVLLLSVIFQRRHAAKAAARA